jgi:hypothetical protein
MDFAVCADGVTQDTYARGGPGSGPVGSCSTIFADNGTPTNPFAAVCLGSPLSIFVHLQDATDGAGIGQDFTLTVNGPGYTFTNHYDGPDPDSQWDIAQVPIPTPTQLGTYSVTIVTDGTTYSNFSGGHTVLPDSGTGTFEVLDCSPPPPGKPGCGFGDTNHDHTGPPTDRDLFDPARCPSQAGSGNN